MFKGNNMKLNLGTPSIKPCPECGSETVIEGDVDLYGKKTKIRRCDGLIEIHPDKPLEACTWSEEIFGNGKVRPVTL